jgi:hypothetical protein
MEQKSEEALVQFRGALGEGHFSMIHPIVSIAYAKSLRGDPDAETFIRTGIGLQEAQLPPGHYERAVGLTFLGFVLMKKNKLVEAEQVLREALEIRRKTFKQPNWRIAETAGFLGEVAALQSHKEAAKSLLDESLQTFTTIYGPSNPRTEDAGRRLHRYFPR